VEKFALADAFSRIDEHWRPKVVADVNDHELKIVKVRGVFPWHSHDDIDELFLVWRGTFRLEFRDRVLCLGPGEGAVAPRGVEHRTAADDEAEVLVFEARGVVNTGNAPVSAYTAPVGARLEG
jgi:mannose-6-phosphate isomerase-like protein (cupin superfamily)